MWSMLCHGTWGHVAVHGDRQAASQPASQHTPLRMGERAKHTIKIPPRENPCTHSLDESIRWMPVARNKYLCVDDDDDDVGIAFVAIYNFPTATHTQNEKKKEKWKFGMNDRSICRCSLLATQKNVTPVRAHSEKCEFETSHVCPLHRSCHFTCAADLFRSFSLIFKQKTSEARWKCLPTKDLSDAPPKRWKRSKMVNVTDWRMVLVSSH